MKIEGDTVTFESTGRETSVNCGIIGIDSEGEIYEGYDGGFDTDETLRPELALFGELRADCVQRL